MLPGHLERIERLEWEPAAQHPVEQHSEGVDVARRRHRPAGCLLGRHVGGRPEERPVLRERVRAAHAGDPEVGDLRPALFVEDDVRRLQVPVDKPVRMGVSKPGRELACDLCGALVVQGLPWDEAILERSAGKVLEDHVGAAFLASVVEETADVRVRERGDRVRFALEAHRVGTGAEQLDGDGAVELIVVCNPDLGHAAGTEPALEAIAAADHLAHDGSSL